MEIESGERPTVGPCSGLEGDSIGNAVQPARQRFALANGRGVLGEGEEGGLEGVLGILIVAQDMPADVPDERPMALEQNGERRLLARRAESRKELSIGQFSAQPGGCELTQPAQHGDEFWLGHQVHPREASYRYRVENGSIRYGISGEKIWLAMPTITQAACLAMPRPCEIV